MAEMRAERLLTVKETAKLWNVSERTVYRKIWSGELPVVLLTPKTPRIKESVVVQYVESKCFPDASQG
jgi:excisionase family DNA binding protein